MTIHRGGRKNLSRLRNASEQEFGDRLALPSFVDPADKFPSVRADVAEHEIQTSAWHSAEVVGSDGFMTALLPRCVAGVE